MRVRIAYYSKSAQQLIPDLLFSFYFGLAVFSRPKRRLVTLVQSPANALA
jgi:hypothetical protein